MVIPPPSRAIPSIPQSTPIFLYFIHTIHIVTNNPEEKLENDNLLRSCESLGGSSFEKFTSCCLTHFL